MAIFRGVGGSGDSSDNSFLDAVTAQANSASASATSAANSLAAIQQTEVTSASFNTGDGVLTLTKTGGATVTADLDGRFLTSYTETNNLTTAVTWADVPDANITESSVTQHLTAANVTSPLTGGTGISIASNGTITNDSPDQTVALTGTGATTITGTYPNFTINSVNTTYTVGDGGLTTNDFTDADHSKLNGIEANATADQTGAEIKSAYEAVSDTNAFTDAEKTKLSGIEASADVTDATNVTSAGAAMLASSPTFTGTITAPNVDISTTGSVTTNIATGGTTANTNVKVVNIGTGYGAGFYAGDSTTINMGGQATSAKNIFNLGSGVSVSGKEDTINLKGNVVVDGALTVGGVPQKTQRTRFLKRGYLATSTINVLSTSLSRIGDLLQTKASNGSENEIEFSMGLTYADTYGTNDGAFNVIVTAPTPTDENTVSLGTVASVTTSGSLYTIIISGDVTKHLSPYCGMSVNANGSSAFGFNNSQGWYYLSSSDTTYITMYAYQANKPTQGDTVYLHPFDWETSGTEILGTEYQFDSVVYNASLMFREYQNVYLGYFKSNLSVQVKAKEVTQSSGEEGTNISVRSIEGKITQTES